MYEQLLGTFDVRLVSFITKKISPGRKVYESFDEIGAAFNQDVRTALGPLVNAAAFPFADEGPSTSAADSGTTMTGAMIDEIGDTGVLKAATLRMKGFDVGIMVESEDGEQARILDMTDTQVQLRGDKRRRFKVSNNVFVQKYKLLAPAPEAP